MPSKFNKRIPNTPLPNSEVEPKKSGRLAVKQQDKDMVAFKKMEKANPAQIEGAGS